MRAGKQLLHKKTSMETAVETNPISSGTRALLGAMVILGVLLLMGGALTIPFKFESSSIYYKFGLDRIVLRTAKMVGLTAAVLMLLQLVLVGRLKWMDRIFSQPGLYRAHRFNAFAIGTLVVIHPILIQTAAHAWMIPLKARYWPQWAGAGLLAAILVHLGFGRWRRQILRTYGTWRWIHGVLAVAIYTGLIVHILNVSESFDRGSLPREWVIAAALALGLLWVWFQTGRLRSRRNAFRVIRTTVAGRDARTIELAAEGGRRFDHLPGQFAWVSFRSPHIAKEFHPFTIASSPSRPSTIQFTIRCCGDWTRKIDGVREEDRAFIQGPYGRFSHLFLQPQREIIMIAGGIGITPMLSMLRYMRDHGDPRRIILIWSNRTRAHLFDREELEAIAHKLTGFKWVPIFTREESKDDRSRRLDTSALEQLVNDCGRDAAIFLCGPPAMVVQIRASLKRIGFSGNSIYTEAFGF
jgi:predicted ferric reductase